MTPQPERPIFATADPNKIEVLHRYKLSKKYRRKIKYGMCCHGGCWMADKALEGSYIAVHENRVEYNYSLPFCCTMWDYNNIVYFDRDVTQHANKATCCAPSLTHMSLIPDCFGICGETVVMHGDITSKRRVVGESTTDFMCMTRGFIMLPGLDDAEQVANVIQNVSSAKRLRMQPSAGPVMTAGPIMAAKPSVVFPSAPPLYTREDKTDDENDANGCK